MIIDPLLPPASTLAPRVDHLFVAMAALTGLVAISVALLMLIFVVRYRRGSKADRRNPPSGAFWLEVGWTGIPLLAFFIIFLWSTQVFSQYYRPPRNAAPVYVLAKQWMWRIEHPNGRREINQLHVPLGYPVKLIMTSQDVIHSFYVPAFRLKQDVLPGRYTYAWFKPTRTGRFTLTCTQYCGALHYAMLGQVIVMRDADYARWLATPNEEPDIIAQGAALFRSAGCSGCHAAGSSVHAPELRGLYGRPVPLSDGTTVTADDNYLLDSILEPEKQIVRGFAPIMPSFRGQLSQDDLDALLAYLRSQEVP
ncbi:MAG TPA: cytochrome c oxidase subunit II [Steroidobacteraceae bacterium]|nr:cytochrome c oxidase subunit II [Steroidobacteraceae bacterium]